MEYEILRERLEEGYFNANHATSEWRILENLQRGVQDEECAKREIMDRIESRCS